MDRRGGGLLAVVALLAVLGAVGMVVLFETVDHLLLVILIPAMFLIGAIPIILRVLHGTFDLFEITIPYFLMYFLFYGAGALFVLFVKDVAYDGQIVNYLDQAVALCTLGLACSMLGYFFSRRIVPVRLEEPGPRPGWFAIGAIFGVGYIGQILSAQGDQRTIRWGGSVISGMTSLVTQLSFLTTFALFYAIYIIMSKQAPKGMTLLLVGVMIPATLLALFLRVGNKTTLILTFSLPFIAFWYVRRRVPWKSLTAFALVIVFGVFPLYYMFRTVKGNYYTQSYRIERAVGMLKKQDTSEYTENALSSVAKRLAIVNSTAAVIRDCGDRVEYQQGKTLWLGVLTVAIPRFLWPDKPTTNIGTWFGKTFHITAFGNYSFISISMAGELYWNFHLPGVIVGMLLMGLWLRVLYHRFGAIGGRNPLRLAMYIVLMAETVVQAEGAIGSLEGGLVKQVLILLAIEKSFILVHGIANRHTVGAQAIPSALAVR